jgi:hypothetical protein
MAEEEKKRRRRVGDDSGYTTVKSTDSFVDSRNKKETEKAEREAREQAALKAERQAKSLAKKEARKEKRRQRKEALRTKILFPPVVNSIPLYNPEFYSEHQDMQQRNSYVNACAQLGVSADFLQVYISAFDRIAGLKCEASLKILFLAFTRVGQGNLVSFSDEMKEHFKEVTGLSKVSWYRGLAELLDAELFFKEGENIYRLNPSLFWQGSTWGRVNHLYAERFAKYCQVVPVPPLPTFSTHCLPTDADFEAIGIAPLFTDPKPNEGKEDENGNE